MREPLMLTRTSPPVELPIGLGEIRAHLRLEDDGVEEEAAAMAAVRAATETCESSTRRALITQEWSLFRDRWPPDRAIVLPRPPLQAVVEVTLFDGADQATPWPADNYLVDTASTPGRLVLRNGRAVPAPGRAVQGISIRFTAGYGDHAAAVPEALRAGILRLATYLFEHRGDTATADPIIGSGAASLWRPFLVPLL